MAYTELYSNGTLVSSAQIMTGGILVSGGNNSMYISSGGTATGTIISSGGRMSTYSGGTATGTIISSGGRMSTYSGGTATGTTINAGGSLFVSSGGILSSTTISSGGILNGFIIQEENYYSSGIHISNAIVHDHATLYDDQTATDITVNSNGYLSISNGGMATGTTIKAGGRLRLAPKTGQLDLV